MMRSSKSRGEDLPAHPVGQAVGKSLRPILSRLANSIFLLIPLLWVLAPITAEAQGRTFAEGRILVKPRAGLPEAQFDSILRRSQGRQIGRVGPLRVRIVQVPFQAEAAVVRALSRNRHIEFAELDELVTPDQTIPNDPNYPKAWHLPKILAPSAWDTSLGDRVTIAIVDTGVDALHLDLSSKLVAGWNPVSGNTDTADIYGHGTKVAGTAGAASNNLLGVASVAWNADIMPVRITNNSSTGAAYTSHIASGITWAADHGADVANVSYRIAGSLTVQNAARYMKNKGGVVVVAGGNTGDNPGWAASSALIAVSATTSSDTRASWSSYGNHVDVAAPGVGIWTTTRGGGYGSPSGTSFASPITAGVVALIIAANDSLSPDEIEAVLKSTADDLGDPGWDSYFGFGRVNASAAVALAANAIPGDTTPPKVSVTSPSPGSDVSGLVDIGVHATDEFGVSRVELYARGRLVGTDTTFPYQFTWDTVPESNGSATLMALAYDAAGNEGRSTDVNVMVANESSDKGDTTPPKVTISSPGDGATVSGTVNLSAFASDDTKVAMVKIYVDGQLKCAGSPSTSCGWNTRKAGSGSHTVSAIAEDSAGNTATASVTVNVVARTRGSKGKGRGKKK